MNDFLIMNTDISYYEDYIREALEAGNTIEETVNYIMEIMADEWPQYHSYDVETYVIELQCDDL